MGYNPWWGISIPWWSIIPNKSHKQPGSPFFHCSVDLWSPKLISKVRKKIFSSFGGCFFKWKRVGLRVFVHLQYLLASPKSLKVLWCSLFFLLNVFHGFLNKSFPNDWWSLRSIMHRKQVETKGVFPPFWVKLTNPSLTWNHLKSSHLQAIPFISLPTLF